MFHQINPIFGQYGRLVNELPSLGGMALNQALKQEGETTSQLAMAAFGVGSQLGVLLPYSRKHEQEADELGLYFKVNQVINSSIISLIHN